MVKMKACKNATNNSIRPINTAKGTAIAEAKTVLNMKIKQIKLNTRMWPAVMFANKRIIKEIGFPTIEKVGKKANEAAWLVIQHAIEKPSFMKKCIQLLELAVNEEKASEINLA